MNTNLDTILERAIEIAAAILSLIIISSCASFTPSPDARIGKYHPPINSHSSVYHGGLNAQQIEHLKCGDFPQLTRQERELIVQVNRRVNNSITYLSDQEDYGVVNFEVTDPGLRRPLAFGFPIDRYGDCEDYALTKKKRLIQEGMDPTRLFIARARVPCFGTEDQCHSVLAIPEGSQWWVLDNMDNRIEPASYLEKWWGWKFVEPCYNNYKLGAQNRYAHQDPSNRTQLRTQRKSSPRKKDRFLAIGTDQVYKVWG